MIITTPIGNVYHGSDYKIDKAPVDGIKCDIEFIKKVSSEEGIKLCLTDCLGVERTQWGESESTVGPELERIMSETKGKCIITLMSSHIHRIQQVIDAAANLGRRVALVGRSVERNVQVATDLHKLTAPLGVLIDKTHAADIEDEKLTLIVAGSQGQEGSAMMRAIYGTHPEIQIKPQDKVIFSADAIPGNEINYYGAVDELCINGVETIYPAIDKGVHHSGHANEPEQVFLLETIKPKWVMPIGGNNRHRVRYKNVVAPKAGIAKNQVLLPLEGEMLGLNEAGEISLVDNVFLRPQYVDGLGVGDVGPAVLRDRQTLSQSGMLIVIIKRKNGRFDLDDVRVVSRGFVFMRDAQEVVDYIKSRTADLIKELSDGKDKKKIRLFELETTVEKKLAKSLYKIIEREPMIEVEVIDF
jgi:ribonuclease J